ncbi:MAG: (Fe-S)-binding protein [Candidatus Heimdallarchaeota archaeon]|nr:(Fe-S)-binding protein [Candidatus Heimdallarchaeota archaeon]
MEEYNLFRASGFLLVLVVSLYITIDAIYQLYKLLKRGKPAPERVGNWGARVKAVLVYVFGQKKLLRHPAGIGHLFIFYGFIFVTIVSQEVFVRALFPTFSLSFLGPLYKILIMGEDILSLTVILFIIIGLWRRYITKPIRFKDDLVQSKGLNRDATIILIAVGLHMIFGMLLESLEIYKGVHPLGDEAPNVAIISGALSKMWSSDPIVLEEIIWFSHAATVWVFMIYIFGTNIRVPKYYPSKHFHILSAVVNVFFMNLGYKGKLRLIPFEDEDLEIYGVNDVMDLTWPQMLDLYSCTGCGRCQEVCPAYLNDQPLSPKALILNMRDQLLEKATIIRKDPESELELETPLIGGAVPTDMLWSCTTCLACTVACPVLIEHVDKIIDLRRYQAMMEADFPSGIENAMNAIEVNSNPWNISKSDRDLWAEGLDIKRMKDHPNTELLFYVGCAGSFDDRAKKVSTDLVKILRAAGIDFAILGKEEKCTGDPARRLGNEYLAVELMQQNVELLSQYQFKEVVTMCAHCYNNLANELPDFFEDKTIHFKVYHAVDYMAKLLKDGKIKVDGDKPLNITYHDACYLGRHNDKYHPPREILKQFNGVNHIEMEMNKDMALCCGGGGGKAFYELEGGKDINKTRVEMALKTGSDVIGVSCPFCTIMLEDGIKNSNADIEVLDLVEIVADRLIIE